MQFLTSEIINLLKFLLPGFITLYLISSLTSFPKKNEFESVIIALIFTMAIQPGLYVVNLLSIRIGIGKLSSDGEIFWLVIIAIFLGILFSFFLNNDHVHKILRKLKITNQTSYPSEWYGVFSENVTYIVLHLDDGRRLYGWPDEWPSDPKTGHFILLDASWLLDEVDESPIDLLNVDRIVIESKCVEMVEFIRMTEVNEDGSETPAIQAEVPRRNAEKGEK